MTKLEPKRLELKDYGITGLEIQYTPFQPDEDDGEIIGAVSFRLHDWFDVSNVMIHERTHLLGADKPTYIVKWPKGIRLAIEAVREDIEYLLIRGYVQGLRDQVDTWD